MERYCINLHTPFKNSREIEVSKIEYDTSLKSFVFTVDKEKMGGLSVGSYIFYERSLYKGNNEYAYIRDRGRIVKLENDKITITAPFKVKYQIKNMTQIGNDLYLVLNKKHHLFQQDLKYYSDGKLKILDTNNRLIKSLLKDEFSVPLKYENRGITIDDCIQFVNNIKTCGNDDCRKIEVYEYVFFPEDKLRQDCLLLHNCNIEDFRNANFIVFDYCPYFYKDNDDIKVFKDDWYNESYTKLTKCQEISTKENKFCLKIYDNYYKIDLSLFSDTNETCLGNDDVFGTSFVNNIINEIIPETIDMERLKYSPSYYSGGSFNDITGITFCLHFRKRDKISDNERTTMNTVYTSGNVYYDTWHIDEETRDTVWWNDFDYSGTTFNMSKFIEFNNKRGKKSDLIGYLNFTNDDIYFRKKKVSQSFLRISFYTSPDPIEQKLLYYSTVFLDDGELYGKYLKQLYNLKKTGEIERNRKNTVNKINENAFVVLYPDGIRVDSEINITNEFDRLKSSEGFNIYLFSEDKDFYFENGEKTIYMKVDFNHAGNGKTIPMINWPKDKDGNFTALTTDNFIKSLYIPIKLYYLKDEDKYVYSITDGYYENNNITLVLYEPKLDV